MTRFGSIALVPWMRLRSAREQPVRLSRERSSSILPGSLVAHYAKATICGVDSTAPSASSISSAMLPPPTLHSTNKKSRISRSLPFVPSSIPSKNTLRIRASCRRLGQRSAPIDDALHRRDQDVLGWRWNRSVQAARRGDCSLDECDDQRQIREEDRARQTSSTDQYRQAVAGLTH